MTFTMPKRKINFEKEVDKKLKKARQIKKSDMKKGRVKSIDDPTPTYVTKDFITAKKKEQIELQRQLLLNDYFNDNNGKPTSGKNKRPKVSTYARKKAKEDENTYADKLITTPAMAIRNEYDKKAAINRRAKIHNPLTYRRRNQ